MATNTIILIVVAAIAMLVLAGMIAGVAGALLWRS